MNRKRKYPKISVHQTMFGKLNVDWDKEYKGEFVCPNCQSPNLSFYKNKTNRCQLEIKCKSCKKRSGLSLEISGSKKSIYSEHQTLNGILKVNWRQEYNQEYHCQYCMKGTLKYFYIDESTKCKIKLQCDNCRKKINLTCPVKAYIYNYAANIQCPNPICTRPNNLNEWVYLSSPKNKRYQCHFCQLNFNPYSSGTNSWMRIKNKDDIQPFSFNEDIWDLRHFYDQLSKETLNFKQINSQWYKLEAKKYIYYLLKSRKFDSGSSFSSLMTTIRQFGRVINNQEIIEKTEISRNIILIFIDGQKTISNTTRNGKLYDLRSFFDWLDLDSSFLIRSRDFLKRNKSDPNWLDYGCSSFRPSTSKLSLYERQYQGEQQRLTEAEKVGAELAQEEAKATIEAMDKWLSELRKLANG